MSNTPTGKVANGRAFAEKRMARLAAVQALYQMETSGDSIEDVLGDFIERNKGWRLDEDEFLPSDRKVFTAIMRCAIERRSEVDAIATSAVMMDGGLPRLEILLRSILRAGVAELLASSETAPRIIISDMVEIARGFYDKTETSMVNAVLDRAARTLRPAEMPK